MRTYMGSTAIHRGMAMVIPLFGVAWFVTSSATLTFSNVLALVGVFTAFAWVVKTTYRNSEATVSFAQLLTAPEPRKARTTVRETR